MKLVAEDGVGTIAAGVAKALAEVVQISGANGGTGASPLMSIKHAGLPWELGLADTQGALVENSLRARIRVRVDGGFMTGRDVLRRLKAKADVDAVVIDSVLPNPGLASLLAQLRADAKVVIHEDTNKRVSDETTE